MKILLAILLAGHGALHLLGFVKAFKLSAVPLSGRTLFPLPSKVMGIAWLLVALLLVGTAALSLAWPTGWWILGAVALVASQVLIVVAWPDAKAGTLVNVVLLVPWLVAYGHDHFRAQIEAERTLLLEGVAPVGAVVEAAELQPLPPPIRRWLSQAGVVGRPRPQVVHVRQQGGMRTSKTSDFSATHAEQWFRTDPPGFHWQVELSMMGVPVLGRDRYQDGTGHMWITALGLFSVVDARGPKIDQGSALRYLGELVWFPSAALSPRIRWEPIDDRRARAHFSDRKVEVNAEFEIDDQGHFLRMNADRYYGGEAEARLEHWEVPATAWARFEGIEVPTRGHVIWRLKDGDFDYFQWEITTLEFDPKGAGAPPPEGEVAGRSL